MTRVLINAKTVAVLEDTEWECTDENVKGWLEALTFSALSDQLYLPDRERFIVDTLSAEINDGAEDTDGRALWSFDVQHQDEREEIEDIPGRVY